MSKDKFDQIIDEAYENYLTKFIPPINSPSLDVQPSYYEPMSREWFVKSIRENNSRGFEFSERWGLKIEERELNNDELNIFNLLKQTFTKQITITYNNETIESYE